MEGSRRNLLVLLAFLLPLTFAPAASAIGIQPGDPAPDFSLPDIDGNTVTLADYRDKSLLIVFWSTWCSRCIEELTFLRDNYAGRDDVAVLLINQDSEKTTATTRIAELRKRLALPFPVIEDRGLVLWERFGIQALPSSVVIGREGRVVLVEPNYYRGTPDKLLKATSDW